MIPAPNPRIEPYRIGGPVGSNSGAFILNRGTDRQLKVIASDGLGWDHVSVSSLTRTPTWKEMCLVKALFFHAEEAVMQLHPKASEYVNYHPNCLHLWRPQTETEIAFIRAQWGEEWPWGDLAIQGMIPLPPSELVGPKKPLLTT